MPDAVAAVALAWTTLLVLAGGIVLLRSRDTLTTEWDPPLSIRTRDNNETSIEITVPYRIREGEGHALVAMGLRTGYRTRVNETVKNVLRTELAQLSSEDYQDTDTRLGRAQAVLPLLNEQLAKFHVEALSILGISGALCYTFGVMVGDRRQGWIVLAAMTVIMVVMLVVCAVAEQRGATPATLGVDHEDRGGSR